MWSGRFREPLDPEFEAWQRSIVFDWRLLGRGDKPPARRTQSALLAAKILTKDETRSWRAALRCYCCRARIGAGKAPGARSRHRRRHSSLCGTQARGHASALWGSSCTTAAAATEQIATDLRLYVRAQINLVVKALAAWGWRAGRTGPRAGRISSDAQPITTYATG